MAQPAKGTVRVTQSMIFGMMRVSGISFLLGYCTGQAIPETFAGLVA